MTPSLCPQLALAVVSIPSLSQDGIEPMWEDNQNKRGGRWLITLAKQQRHTELDRFWLETVRTGSGQRHPPAAALSPAWGPSPLRSSCASSGRCSMSTAMRCAGPSSTSVPRGIRSPSGPGRRRTGRGSPTSGNAVLGAGRGGASPGGADPWWWGCPRDFALSSFPSTEQGLVGRWALGLGG